MSSIQFGNSARFLSFLCNWCADYLGHPHIYILEFTESY